MHCLFSLKQAGFSFELKGGTSLSKGFGIIDRFSEDIDLRINPSEERGVATGRNQNKPKQVDSREAFYDWLARNISIDGIEAVERDRTFDDAKFRSGGIRLLYAPTSPEAVDLKDGVLLEVGFDDVTPNEPVDSTSWDMTTEQTRSRSSTIGRWEYSAITRDIPSLRSSRRSPRSTARSEQPGNFQ